MNYLNDIFVRQQKETLFCVATPLGHFVEVNQAWTEKLGWSAAELTTVPYINFVHPEDIEATLKEANKIDEGYDVINFENRYRHKKGHYLWLSWTTSLDDDKQLIFCTVKEITKQKQDITELQRQKNFYESILASIEEGFIVQDRSGQILEFNELAQTMIGSVVGDKLNTKYPRDGWSVLKEDGSILSSEEYPFEIARKTGAPQKNVTMGIKSPRGEVLWLQVNSAPLKLFKGDNEWGILTTFADITKKNNEKRILAESEMRLKEAQSVAHIGSWKYDLENMKFTCTEELAKIFELDKENHDVKYEDIIRRLHPDDKKVWVGTFEQCKRDGDFHVILVRDMRPDKIVWIEKRARGIKNSKGEVVSIFGTCQDISERVQLELENNFIIDSLDIGIWKWNIRTNQLIWGQIMYNIYDSFPVGHISKYEDWKNVLVEEDRDVAEQALFSAIRGEKDFDTTFRVRTSNNQIRWVGARGFVIRNEKGEPIQIYGINWDKTKQVLLEREVEMERAKNLHNAKLASLGEMSAGVAHEINNPLAIISGMTNTLTKYLSEPEKLVDRIEKINKAVVRISKIVQGLKKFARSGLHSTRTKSLVSSIAKEAVLSVETKTRQFKIQIEIENFSRSKVLCDVLEIEQVIINLLENSIDAIKSQSEKWIRIFIKDEANHVVMRVVDSGKGISDSISEKIFDPFFTTKIVGEGTGLGLSISRGIIADHNGSISVIRGQENTCFEIRLPIVRSVDEGART